MGNGCARTLSCGARHPPPSTKREVRALKITVLVTNLAGNAWGWDGEWGYSALVEADGRKILYDTGSSPGMVLKNARALHVDLSDVEDVILGAHQRFSFPLLYAASLVMVVAALILGVFPV